MPSVQCEGGEAAEVAAPPVFSLPALPTTGLINATSRRSGQPLEEWENKAVEREQQ